MVLGYSLVTHAALKLCSQATSLDIFAHVLTVQIMYKNILFRTGRMHDSVVTNFVLLTCRGDPEAKAEYDAIASAVFSSPPLASVGLSEEQAIEDYGDVDVYTSSFK